MKGLIDSNKTISCTLCNRVFDAHAVQKAMENNCLTFPNKRRHREAFIDWDTVEEEHKKQCLLHLHLRTVPLSADEIREQLPLLTQILRDRYPIIPSETIDNLKFLFVSDTDRYLDDWNLQYTDSVYQNPFPSNLRDVLSRRIGPPPSEQLTATRPILPKYLYWSSLSLRTTIAILSTLRADHKDNERLRDHCPSGYLRWCITERKLAGTTDVMKALIYSHMFSTDSGAREMPKDAVCWAHDHLKPFITNLDSSDDEKKTMQILKLTLWIILGRTLLTMLFQIVELQPRL
jgi:hypothetical protein